MTTVKVKRTRCPNGTRKHTSGHCIPKSKGKDKKSNIPEPKSSIPELFLTERGKYAKKYFTDNRVTLLNKYPEDLESVREKKLLFQVSFSTPEQFTNYVNLHEKPYIDCVYQSIFALGLREVNLAKQDAREVNEKGVGGVYTEELLNYLTNTFHLIPSQLTTVDKQANNKNNETQKEINNMLQKKLKNGYATLLFLHFFVSGKIDYNHQIVAYKYKHKIYYFDPQKKGFKNDKHVLSKTLSHLLKYSGNVYLPEYGYIMIDELPEPRVAESLICPIPYLG